MITPKECANLFSKHNLRPIKGQYITQEVYNTQSKIIGCCAVGIIGYDKNPQDPMPDIMKYKLGFSDYFHFGIVNGFDYGTNLPKSCYRETSKDFHDGVAFGQEVRKLVGLEK